jgi:hypothetical protein
MVNLPLKSLVMKMNEPEPVFGTIESFEHINGDLCAGILFVRDAYEIIRAKP